MKDRARIGLRVYQGNFLHNIFDMSIYITPNILWGKVEKKYGEKNFEIIAGVDVSYKNKQYVSVSVTF